MDVTLTNRQRKYPVHAKAMLAYGHWLADRLAEQAPRPPWRSLSIVLVRDRLSARINQTFLGHVGPTDVISFTYPDPHGQRDGELIVNLDAAYGEAAARGLDPNREAALYLLHGCLHLAGHDDDIPSARTAMRNAERLGLKQAEKAGLIARLLRQASTKD